MRKGSARTHDSFDENKYSSQDRLNRKRPRSDDFGLAQDAALPIWLSQDTSNICSQESSLGTYVGHTANSHPGTQVKITNRTGRISWHARIYVGNLPGQIGLQNAAYKELFSALYVTAFGSLKPGEVAPVQSFWLHSCGRYGFLQMRGNKEAVNVMIFNGLFLYGRNIRLSRPTGYRPEVKSLSAEEYVPDRVDGKRVEVLFKALSGIVGAPREKAYLLALRPKIGAQQRDIVESRKLLKIENEGQSIDSERVDNNKEDASRSSSEKNGTVVAMADMMKF